MGFNGIPNQPKNSNLKTFYPLMSMDTSDVENPKQHMKKSNPTNLVVNDDLFGLFRGYDC